MSNANLVEKIRAARLKIAEKRARDVTIRYPEIAVTAVRPLSDAQVIEYAHQKQVLADIERSGE